MEALTTFAASRISMVTWDASSVSPTSATVTMSIWGPNTQYSADFACMTTGCA